MKSFLVFIILFVSVITISNAQNYYKITASSLNIRAEASAKSEKVGKLQKGDSVLVLNKKENNWVEIETGSIKGFVSSKYLEKMGTNKESSQIPNSLEKFLPKNLETKDYLIAFGVIFLIGLIFGYSKTVVVYQDFSDLTKTFLLFAVPITVSFFLSDETKNGENFELIQYSLGAFMIIMFLWVVYSTFKANSNIVYSLLALIVKLPLAFLLILMLWNFFSDDKNKTASEKLKEKISIGVIILLILGLVRHRVWRYKPDFVERDSNMYNRFDNKIEGMKNELADFKL